MNNEKPLPKPPKQKKPFEEDDPHAPLLSDKLAMAMAEGRLDELMKRELPDNEYAKNLTMMMLGMTGMTPPSQPEAKTGNTADEAAKPQISEDVIKAAQSGDVKELMTLLQQEYKKRNPDAQLEPAEKTLNESVLTQDEKGIMDSLLKIAKDNNVELDWLIQRALKLYILEYQKTGKL
jgi:hypothetical protein